MSKKSKIVLLTIYVIAFLVTFVATTMAFFVVTKVATVTPEADITSATLSSLYFGTGSSIKITADIDNFAEGMDSLSDETSATATLKAGSDGVEIVEHYNIDLIIDENDLLYSTPDKKPELILIVTDPEGNEIKDISGLEYVTEGEYKGFDITTKTGVFNITNNREIRTNTEITENWEVKVVFINHNVSQNLNQMKNLKGYLKIYKPEE